MRSLQCAARLTFGASALTLIAACYVHTRAHMTAPGLKRPPLCTDAVRFFDAPADLEGPYTQVARISAWWPADMIAHVSTVESAVRNKAAKLGANGIIRGQLVGLDTVQPRYKDNVAGIAIFIPMDSARAAGVCARHTRS